MNAATAPADPDRPPASHVWLHGDEGGDFDDPDPWLLNADGIPVTVPDDALGYRVRFLAPRSRGMGEPMVDEDTGRPLLIDPNAGPDAFCEAVGYAVGRYRLLAVDRRQRPIETAEVAIVLITERMAARARSASAVVASPAVPSPPVVAEPNSPSSITERLLSLLEESLRAHRDHAALGLSAAAELLRAAGDAGIVKRAAAVSRSPFSVEPPATEPAPAGPVPMARNAPVPAAAVPAAAVAAAAAANVASEAAADDVESVGTAAAIVGRFFDTLAPVVNAVAPAVSFKANKWAGMSDEAATAAAQAAGNPPRPDGASPEAPPAAPSTPETTPAAPAAPPRSGVALLAHVMVIQGRLEPAAQAWVGALLARHPHLVAELRDVVAALTVEEGVATVHGFRAVHAGLTDRERRYVDNAIAQPSGMRKLLDLIDDKDSIEDAIDAIRACVERADRPPPAAPAPA